MSDYETLDQKLNAEILENKRLREALEYIVRHHELMGGPMSNYSTVTMIAKQALEVRSE